MWFLINIHFFVCLFFKWIQFTLSFYNLAIIYMVLKMHFLFLLLKEKTISSYIRGHFLLLKSPFLSSGMKCSWVLCYWGGWWEHVLCMSLILFFNLFSPHAMSHIFVLSPHFGTFFKFYWCPEGLQGVHINFIFLGFQDYLFIIFCLFWGF